MELAVVLPDITMFFVSSSFVSLFSTANISVIETLVLQPENDISVSLKAYLYTPYLSLFYFLFFSMISFARLR